MFYSLVLLIKTINTYYLYMVLYLIYFKKYCQKKDNWLRQRLAEAETEITHVESGTSPGMDPWMQM